MGLSRPKLISGGRAWVWGCVQNVQRYVVVSVTCSLFTMMDGFTSLSLNVHTIMVKSEHIYTKLGVPVSAIGIAQVCAMIRHHLIALQMLSVTSGRFTAI